MIVVTAGVVLGASQAVAQSLPNLFNIESITYGLDLPVAFDWASDDMVYVAEKSGVVVVIEDGVKRTNPFIDISDSVNSSNDRGLLGLAVHPQFPDEPYVYLLYTYDPPETAEFSGAAGPDGPGNRVSRLTRVTADASRNYRRALEDSEVVLLGTNSVWGNIGDPAGDFTSRGSCEFAFNNYIRDCIAIDEISHTIGDIRFAPDGALIVSSGDGASYHSTEVTALRSQHVDSLSGKLLRIDPMTGEGLPDNPWYNNDPGANRSKVWSMGLRNPFRFTIHPQTGEPAIGDVGWSNWEEVNIGSGRNFGWPCYEGADGFNQQQQSYENFDDCVALYAESFNVTAPAYAYDHLGSSASVQVGDYQLGNTWPAAYRGALFYTDINLGEINYLTFDAGGAVSSKKNFATDEFGVAQMRLGADGDLYYLNLFQGVFRAIRFDATNQPPVAKLRKNRAGGTSPLTIEFTAESSSDPEGGPLTYDWDFGDGSRSTEVSVDHVYTVPGRYNVVLRVTDDAGHERVDTTEINVDNRRPTVTLTSTPDDRLYKPGEWVALSATANDPDEGDLPASSITWSGVLLHAEHIHPDFFAATGEQTGFLYPDHGDNTLVRICVIATDSLEFEAREVCVDLEPQTIEYTIATEPQGYPVTYDGVTRLSPLTVTTVKGGKRTIAVSQSNDDGTSFTNWSDGGELTHEIVVQDEARTLTAFFDASVDLDLDGLTAIDEARWSTDPYTADPDTDRDGVADVIDSNPTKSIDSGRSHYLIPGEVLRGKFGFGYGEDEYYSRMRIAFDNPGSDVQVQVRGYDVQNFDEVAIRFSNDGENFEKIGSLTRGNANALNAITRSVVSVSQMSSGRNWIEFRNKRPGETWGIRALKLEAIGVPTPETLIPGERLPGIFGYKIGPGLHKHLLRTQFQGTDQDLTLRFKAYNLQKNRKLKVRLNGETLFESKPGTADVWSTVNLVTIPASSQLESNLLEFIVGFPGETWGVRGLLLQP